MSFRATCREYCIAFKYSGAEKQCKDCVKPEARIYELESRLSQAQALPDSWRDWAGQSGESAYSEVMICVKELEAVVGKPEAALGVSAEPKIKEVEG